ncbi:helix-turn-helix transcriptional regulator [Brevibacterium otitidis]|uniref:Helix-turn-helix transcriptional regulator n=1 Tax=Brevibacterium otitidis TaxID=53364 RepID=A0ABV5WYA8_9MICO|nr:YafY family protein [Brevibacterium otitidis]
MNQIRQATERLLNLLIALRAACGWVDRDTLRRKITGYHGLSDDAFDRRFSRDKDALRDLGIEISTTNWTDIGSSDTVYGYRITHEDYELPAIDFTPAEAAALSVAADWWRSSPVAGQAERARHKLTGLGTELSAQADGSEPLVAPSAGFWPGDVATAIRATSERLPVRFSYRKTSGETATRTLEPYALLTRGNRVYLMGRDVDRDAVRTFRLSRIMGRIRKAPRRTAGDYEIPAGFDAAAHFNPAPEPGTRRQAVIAIAPGRAEPLRREGTHTGTTAQGWDTFALDFDDAELCATTLAEFGPSVRVMSPRELAIAHHAHVQATISALTGLIGAGDDSEGPADDSGGAGDDTHTAREATTAGEGSDDGADDA